jgi:nucleotide-binding universal stress UspA family protein
MSYKTILVHVDLSPRMAARVRLAAAISKVEGAHLIGAAMTGISRFVSPDSNIELARPVIAGFIDTLHQHATLALEQFDTLAHGLGVASCEKQLISDDPEGGLVQLARFCDLVVLSQTDPGRPVAGAVRDLPEYVMLSCARPVCMVPYAGEFDNLDGRAVVGWNDSIEATRAVTQAIPLLRRASGVTVAVFENGGPQDVPASQLVGLAAWLARHQVNAEVEVLHAEIDAGDALLSLATDRAAGLIVLGGYGHTRFRELMLGGVTETVLRKMTTPILMSH